MRCIRPLPGMGRAIGAWTRAHEGRMACSGVAASEAVDQTSVNAQGPLVAAGRAPSTDSSTRRQSAPSNLSVGRVVPDSSTPQLLDYSVAR